MIKTFWFDLGNVILYFDFGPAYKRLSRHSKKTVEEIAEYFRAEPALEAHLDEGRVNARALYRRIARDLGVRGLPYEDFKHVWSDIFDENKPVIRLIRKLRKNGHRLILISNTNRLHYEYILKQYGVLKLFHKCILSFRVRSRKPKRKIYSTAFRFSRAAPSEIFYTDDREELTAAASRNHGVRSHTYRDFEGLKKALVRLKVPVE